MKVGGYYKFDYEKSMKIEPWESVDISQGWATLRRMGYDYKGDPQMNSTCIEVKNHNMVEIATQVLRLGVQLTKKGETYLTRLDETDACTIGNISIMILNREIVGTSFQNS